MAHTEWIAIEVESSDPSGSEYRWTDDNSMQLEQKEKSTALRFSISSIVRLQGEQRADSKAILAPGRPPLSYGALRQQAHYVRSTLNGWGIGRGDRVALIVPSRPEMAVALLAVADCATVVPLNPDLSAPELETAFTRIGVRAVLIEAGVKLAARVAARRLRLAVLYLLPEKTKAVGRFTLHGGGSLEPDRPGPAALDDIAIVSLTSGTTAKQKIVPLSHLNLAHRTWQQQQIFGLKATDRSLNVMPLFHGHGIEGILLPSLATGGSVVLLETMDSKVFFSALADFHPTWYSCSPVFHEAFLDLAHLHQEVVEESHLRFIRTASYRMPTELSSRLETVFKAPVVEHYGCSEASTITSNRVPPGPRKLGSAGVILENRVSIMDSSGKPVPCNRSGQILVSGPGVFDGYEDDPDANAAAFINGWFRTGDLGRFDSEGFLTITGRVKETINRGGEKVSPQEVEEALVRHPNVVEAACFGVPHPTLGEEVGAAVVLRSGKKVTDSELRQLVQSQLTRFKVPRRILRLEALPRGPTGKLERKELLQLEKISTPASKQKQDPPLSSLETLVAALWRDILGVEVQSAQDDFFLLGGDSLRATRLIALVRERIGMELTLGQIFQEASTVSGLAEMIRARAIRDDH